MKKIQDGKHIFLQESGVSVSYNNWGFAILIFSALELSLTQCDPDPSDPNVFGPPGSGPLIRGTDPDQDPSIIKQK